MTAAQNNIPQKSGKIQCPAQKTGQLNMEIVDNEFQL